VRRTILRPVADPEPYLHRLLDLYWQGLSQPLPFLSGNQSGLGQAAGTGKEEAKARQIWENSFQRTGEGGNPAYSYFFSPTELPLSPAFVELTSLFLPILAHLEDDRAVA
jgi:exodeoxyribonuclease V gamma subunit